MEKILLDPVCGMYLRSEDAAGKSEYRGNTYYFCCSGCKHQFEQNPQRYVHRTKPAHTHPH